MQNIGRKYLKRTRSHRFGDDIKVNFYTCCECVDWLHVAHDSVQCRSVLNRVVNTEDGNMVFRSVRISSAMWT